MFKKYTAVVFDVVFASSGSTGGDLGSPPTLEVGAPRVGLLIPLLLPATVMWIVWARSAVAASH